MRLRADWITHLHDIRLRELDLAFGGLPPHSFSAALELGAGDGFQSRALTRIAEKVVSTDLCLCPDETEADGKIVSMICDAERLVDRFPAGSFDLVFSSGMLMCVSDLAATLRGVRTVLTDDGVTVHVVPTVFWKVAQIALYMPHLLVKALERISRQRPSAPSVDGPLRTTNTPKVRRRTRSAIRRYVLPEPAGSAETHRSELWSFRRTNWLRHFRDSGLEVVCVLNGPVASGYGFGRDRLRHWLEAAGIRSEDIIVARKMGASSRHESYFRERAATVDR